MDFSLVIPAYNEAKKIAHDLEEAVKFFAESKLTAEILVVDDGSIDATRQVALEVAQRLSTPEVIIRVLSYGVNRGKGFAVRHGVESAVGRFIAFADAGLCVPFSYFRSALQCLEKGADHAIASRRHVESKIGVTQPWHRRWGSKVFWYVVQWGMGVKVSDTQCGFKVYSSAAAKSIFSKVATDGFMFDIEALIVAKKLGYKEAEFPVSWSNDSDTRYHPIWGTLRNFKELTRIRLSHAIS